MFRRGKKKKKDEPKLSEDEKKKLIQGVTGKPPAQAQQVQPTQVAPPSSKTKYYITKKDVVMKRQTVVTESGQVIETGEQVAQQVPNDIYQLSQDDLVQIIKGVPSNRTIHQMALKMLTGDL